MVMSKEKHKFADLDPLEQERLERETRIHPQGGVEKVALAENFTKAAPNYLKTHKPTIVRKIPEDS